MNAPVRPLFDPAEAERLAEAAGITLLPWQRALVAVLSTGRPFVVSRGRRGGMTTVLNVARKAREAAGHE